MIKDLTTEKLAEICHEAAESAVAIAAVDVLVTLDTRKAGAHCLLNAVNSLMPHWETSFRSLYGMLANLDDRCVYFRVWFVVWEAFSDDLPDLTPPESAPAARLTAQPGDFGYMRKITDVEDPYARTALTKR